MSDRKQQVSYHSPLQYDRESPSLVSISEIHYYLLYSIMYVCVHCIVYFSVEALICTLGFVSRTRVVSEETAGNDRLDAEHEGGSPCDEEGPRRGGAYILWCLTMVTG